LNLFRQLKRYLIYKYKIKTNIDKISQNFNDLSINEIFKYFNTDKGSSWNKNDQGHGYSKYYEKHLNLLKNKEIKILEIGSYSGASAASFVKYFPLSKIYCLDINIKNFKFSSERINVFGLDISKKNMLNKFYKKANILNDEKYFDIIIDDGSHKLSDILISINEFFLNLKPNGFYIIEDYKFPNYYAHLNDCSEIKIDKILDCIEKKEKFNSNIINEEVIKILLNSTEIHRHHGMLENSDIAFIKKLN